MSSPLHNELNEALQDLRARHAEIAATVDRLENTTATATTKDRTVKATVDSRGQLTDLRFSGQRWREMAPKELGTKIVEVVADAQRQAATAANELMAGLVPDGVDLERLREVGPDLDSMIASAIEDSGRWTR